MYPNLYYALKEWFGISIPITKAFNSFGLLLAASFVAAAIVLHREFKRRRLNGTFTSITENVVIGTPVDWKDYLVQGIIGFLVGHKLVGGLVSGDLAVDPPAFIASSKGNPLFGLLLAGVFIYMRYAEYLKVKKKYPTPTKVSVEKWPEHRVGDITLIAAVSGIIGAKAFHFLENWSSFVKNPIQQLIEPAGLTFYGGLIVAAAVLLWYARNVKISWQAICDSVAPGLMIAYAVGRLGCQVSGDGDWGIYNSAYISTPQGNVVLATPQNNLDSAVVKDQLGAIGKEGKPAGHFNYDINEFGKPMSKALVAPSWLPTWTVAMSYKHNVNKEGWLINGTKDKDAFETYLPAPVFPTPFYEFLACSFLFLILWAIRKK